MKPEFHEDFVSNHVDPTSEPYYDFDWEELYARLGEATEHDDELQKRVANAFRPIFQWFINIDLNNKNATEYIGRRAVAFAWVMNPELFEGKSITAVATELGLPKQILSKVSAAVTQEFGIQNRGQAHGWNRGKHAHQKPTAKLRCSDQTNSPAPDSVPDNTNTRVEGIFC